MSRAARRARGIGLALIAGLGYAGCAATGTDSGITSHPTASDAGSGGDEAGSGGENNAPVTATAGKGGLGDINTSPNEAGAGGTPDESCAADVSTAQLVPLDMYVMLDVSGSMLANTSMYDGTGTAITKWAAVKTALEGFFNADTSKGLGVGLQYFPVLKENVPAACSSDADCGTAAPCAFAACAVTGDVCEKQSDCAPLGFGGNACTLEGMCAGKYCNFVGDDCDINGAPVPCVALTTSFCAHPAKCDAASYATPAQPIAALPDAATALVASIEAQTPVNDSPTPTGPALSGAIQQASAWAKAHPDHQVVAVLATDGIPSECTPIATADVAKVAANGLAATPKINTFTIGVFANAEVAQGQAALNAIAKSGGTGAAFVINTSNDVASQFRDALDTIRSAQLGCDFEIPPAKPGQDLDYSLVNVNYKTGKKSSALLYVGSADQCDPLRGGWYYDTDPTVADPSKIEVCPTTCTTFRGATNASVDIAVGCQTVVK